MSSYHLKSKCNMKIGFIQYDPSIRTATENVIFLEESTRSLTNTLLVLPELFLGSYKNFNNFTEQEFVKIIEPLLNVSSDRNLGFVGTAPICVKNSVYNRAFFIRNGKIAGSYDKRKLFGDEIGTLTPGQNPYPIFEFENVRFLIQVCFDNIDPLPCRKAVLRGIDALLAPATVSVKLLRKVIQTRSLENQIVTVFCNRTGEESDGTKYCGDSAVFLPDGRTLFEKGKKRKDSVWITELPDSFIKETTVRRQTFITG